ncbi:hypothetical protein Leryth_022725 [Lithospermum erythrorhizon]|nr:hypothetical protein Leryth_022725 [Lithospermum erythrorhizon]
MGAEGEEVAKAIPPPENPNPNRITPSQFLSWKRQKIGNGEHRIEDHDLLRNLYTRCFGMV